MRRDKFRLTKPRKDVARVSKQRSGGVGAWNNPQVDLTPLTTLGYEGHTAAVGRDPSGYYWLTSRLGNGGTGLDDFAPAIEGIEGATIAGGRAPEGAVIAEVRDRRGDVQRVRVVLGVWIARLDGEPTGERPPVAFRDASGSLVRRPYQQGAERRALPDAATPCPACGEASWERLHYIRRWDLDESGHDEAREELACRACGHSEGTPSCYAAWDAEAEGEDRSDVQADDLGMNHAFPTEAAAALAEAQAAFSVFGVAEWRGPRSIGGWGSSGDRIDSITLIHGPVGTGAEPHIDVQTEFAEVAVFGLEEAARQRLSESLHEGGACPALSEEALALWLHEQHRAYQAVAAAAEPCTETITVGGEPSGFTCVVTAGRWAAAAEHGNLRLLVAGAGLRPGDVRLEVVSDGQLYIEGSAGT
jgi:hypothetical protein